MPFAQTNSRAVTRRSQLASALVGLALTAALGSAQAAATFTTGVLATQADAAVTGTVLEANHFGTDTSHLSGFIPSGSDFYNFSPDAGLQTLLSGAYFQDGGYSFLNLSGLTQGSTYTLQFLLSNPINTTGSSSWINLEGSTFNLTPYYYPSLQPGAWNGAAHYVRATFTASSATELVTFGNGYTYESDRMHLNAYVLSEGAVAAVPEPDSYTMMMADLAGLGFVARRKKKAQARQA